MRSQLVAAATFAVGTSAHVLPRQEAPVPSPALAPYPVFAVTGYTTNLKDSFSFDVTSSSKVLTNLVTAPDVNASCQLTPGAAFGTKVPCTFKTAPPSTLSPVLWASLESGHGGSINLRVMLQWNEGGLRQIDGVVPAVTGPSFSIKTRPAIDEANFPWTIDSFNATTVPAFNFTFGGGASTQNDVTAPQTNVICASSPPFVIGAEVVCQPNPAANDDKLVPHTLTAKLDLPDSRFPNMQLVLLELKFESKGVKYHRGAKFIAEPRLYTDTIYAFYSPIVPESEPIQYPS